MQTQTQTIDQLSAADLERLLAEKKVEERKAQDRRKKAYEGTKDAFIKRVVGDMADLSSQLRELKKHAVQKGNELHDMMYEVYGKEAKEMKSFSLDSECGRFRVQVEKSEKQNFSETAEVAINAIKDILRKKFENRNKSMYNIIDSILMKNNKGDYDERLVAKLRKVESDIDDPEFSKAIDQLSEAFYTYDTAVYVRGYIKSPQSNKWEVIPIQFSAL